MADLDDSIQGAIEAAYDEHTSDGSASAAEPSRSDAADHDGAADNQHDISETRERPERDWPADGHDERQAEAAKPPRSSEPTTTSWADKNPEMFGRLPVEGQRYIRELERDRRDNAALKAEYAPVAKMFEPHKEKIKAAGTSPVKLIEGWSKAETRLLDRNDRANMVAEIMHVYGIDPRELAQSLRHLPQRVAAAQQHQRDAAVKNVSSALDTFSTAKGRDGRPLYPHFKELEASMTAFAQSGVGAGKPHAERLKALYETALWSSPKHRQAMIQQRSSTHVQPRTRGSGYTDLSLREQLEMAVKQGGAR